MTELLRDIELLKNVSRVLDSELPDLDKAS